MIPVTAAREHSTTEIHGLDVDIAATIFYIMVNWGIGQTRPPRRHLGLLGRTGLLEDWGQRPGAERISCGCCAGSRAKIQSNVRMKKIEMENMDMLSQGAAAGKWPRAGRASGNVRSQDAPRPEARATPRGLPLLLAIMGYNLHGGREGVDVQKGLDVPKSLTRMTAASGSVAPEAAAAGSTLHPPHSQHGRESKPLLLAEPADRWAPPAIFKVEWHARQLIRF